MHLPQKRVKMTSVFCQPELVIYLFIFFNRGLEISWTFSNLGLAFGCSHYLTSLFGRDVATQLY